MIDVELSWDGFGLSGWISFSDLGEGCVAICGEQCVDDGDGDDDDDVEGPHLVHRCFRQRLLYRQTWSYIFD